MNSPLFAAVVSTALAPAAVGQINPAVGAALGASDDSVVGPLSLSFAFTLPDGTVVTDVFADSNGRVFGDAGEGSDFTETEGELESDPTQICAYWDDLNPLGGAAIGDVYFNDLGTSALISWIDVVEFGAAAGTEFSVQLELFPDGSFVVCTDARVPANDAIIGSSVGGGAGLPRLYDLSNEAPFGSGSQGTVYEPFDGAAVAFDLVNCCTTWSPNGLGGYLVTTSCPPGTPRPSPVDVTINGPVCTPLPGSNTSVFFAPDGLGGYSTTPNAGVVDLNFSAGTPLTLTDDSSTALALGFSFPLPGGRVVAAIEVDSNGRAFEVGLDTSDFTESTSEFLGEPTAVLAPFWDDLNPAAGGTVWQSTGPSGEFVCTWDGVVEFGTPDPNSFQMVLSPDGRITFNYFSMLSADGLVGLSSGNGAANPGESDLSAAPVLTSGTPEVFEFFLGDNDLGVAQQLPSLSNGSLPLIGQSFDLLVGDAPGSLADFYMLGNAQSVGLGSVGIPCSLETDSVLVTLSTPPGAGYSIMIPPLAGVVGVRLTAQGAVLDPAAGNPVLVLFSNSIDFIIG